MRRSDREHSAVPYHDPFFLGKRGGKLHMGQGRGDGKRILAVEGRGLRGEKGFSN